MAHDLVIRGGFIVDGTGAPGKHGDLAVTGGRIAEVGTVTGRGAREVDARDLVVAPGFIDPHTHYDAQLTWDPSASCTSWHGVTTIVTGNCGGGILDVARLLDGVDANGAGTNVIRLVPHGAVRAAVMGNADREPTAEGLRYDFHPGAGNVVGGVTAITLARHRRWSGPMAVMSRAARPRCMGGTVTYRIPGPTPPVHVDLLPFRGPPGMLVSGRPIRGVSSSADRRSAHLAFMGWPRARA